MDLSPRAAREARKGEAAKVASPPATPVPRPPEDWVDDRGYVLRVKSLPDGSFEIFDPQTGEVDSTFATYDEVVDELVQDEFTLPDTK